MLVALLADTHDNARTTAAAIAMLREHNPAAWLHAGDMVAPEMLDSFAGIESFHFVFGNNEYDHAALRSRALAIKAQCHEHFADLSLAGKRIALMHGHEEGRLQKAARSGDYHYIVHGHTHLRKDQRMGGTRIINPGALHRATTKSVALLNLATDDLRFLELPAVIL